MMWPDLTSILSPIQWAVVGAVATRLYMPERMTQDLDIVIRTVDSSQVRQKLTEAGFIYQGELSIGESSWRTPNGELIDILEGTDVWWIEGPHRCTSEPGWPGLCQLSPYPISFS